MANLFVSSFVMDSVNSNLLHLDQAIHRFLPLSRAEEAALIADAQSGDDSATTELLLHNLTYIKQIAEDKFPYRHDVEDLVNSGIIGLEKAIREFDLTKKSRLMTYARLKIWRAMEDYIGENSLVHIPERERRELAKQKRRAYTVEYFDTHSEDGCDVYPTWYNGGGEEPFEMISAHPTSTRLEDQPISHKDMPDIQAELGTTISQIQAVLGTLPNRKADIFRMTNGLKDGVEHKPETVATYFGISRQRVCQINDEVLDKLRSFFLPYEVA